MTEIKCTLVACQKNDDGTCVCYSVNLQPATVGYKLLSNGDVGIKLEMGVFRCAQFQLKDEIINALKESARHGYNMSGRATSGGLICP